MPLNRRRVSVVFRACRCLGWERASFCHITFNFDLSYDAGLPVLAAVRLFDVDTAAWFRKQETCSCASAQAHTRALSIAFIHIVKLVLLRSVVRPSFKKSSLCATGALGLDGGPHSDARHVENSGFRVRSIAGPVCLYKPR